MASLELLVNDERDWDRDFQIAVNEGLVPKLDDSIVCVSLVPRDMKIDAKFAVELGAMILLDKPIFAIVYPDVPISEKLRRVADVIFVGDIADPATNQRLAKAIAEFAAQHEGG